MLFHIFEYIPIIMFFIKLYSLNYYKDRKVNNNYNITSNASIKHDDIERNKYQNAIYKRINISRKEYFILLVGFNIVINTVIKNIIKQERPKFTDKYGELQKYGMPSGHSQLVWFILFYDIQGEKLHISIILFILACLSSYQRYMCDYHSKIQIIAGGLLGGIIGFYS